MVCALAAEWWRFLLSCQTTLQAPVTAILESFHTSPVEAPFRGTAGSFWSGGGACFAALRLAPVWGGLPALQEAGAYGLAGRMNATSGKVMRDRISSFLLTGNSPRYFFTTAEAS